MLGNRLINTKVAGGGGCTDIVDNYDPFGGNGVALYQLNGDATDVSGNYNGTATNVTYGAGVFGQAGVFNGSSSYIDNTSSSLWSSEITISAWFKTTGNNQRSPIVSIGRGSWVDGFELQVPTSNTIGFSFAEGTKYGFFNSSIDLDDGSWHHYVQVSNASTANFYIDGVEQTGITTGSGNSRIGTGIRIGRFFQTPEQWANGSIDQVRIFNTALTPLEIEALYTEELCICDGTVDTLDILGDGSCIATYQLDGNANDLSGNYSGTPTDVSYGVGEFDLAGVFNGSSSRVGIPNIVNQAADHSASLWIKPTNFSANRGALSMFNGSHLLVYVTTDGGLNSQGAPSAAGSTAGTLTANVWNHIVLTYNYSTTTYTMYVNGVNRGVDVNFNFSGRPNSIGCHNSGVSFSAYFLGEIDQVRIFNKALSAGEVTTLYNETACTKPACSGTTNTLDILGDGSCIATYPLDGSPLDLSGNYNGIQTDVTYPVGYFDLAGSFNGSSSRVVTPITSNFSNVSVSCWVNFNAFGGGDSTLIHKGFYISSDNSQYIHLRYEAYGNNRLTFWIRNNNTYNTGAISNVSISTGVWYHVVGTYDSSGTAKIYVNGVKGIDATGGPTITNSNAWRMGSQRDSANDLNGSLDQVRIFNKALSASEVTTLYNETPCN